MFMILINAGKFFFIIEMEYKPNCGETITVPEDCEKILKSWGEKPAGKFRIIEFEQEMMVRGFGPVIEYLAEEME